MKYTMMAVIAQEGRNANGHCYTEESLKKMVELGNDMKYGIPGAFGQEQITDLPMDQAKFTTHDLVYDEEKKQIHARTEFFRPTPEFEKEVLALLKDGNSKFGPRLVGKLDKDQNIEVEQLISIDLIPNEGSRCIEVMKKLEQKSDVSKTE